MMHFINIKDKNTTYYQINNNNLLVINGHLINIIDKLIKINNKNHNIVNINQIQEKSIY